MNGFDTNILIYACDRADPRKQEIALNLIDGTPQGVLPWQAACEFIASSRKLQSQGFTASHAWDRLSEFLAILRLVVPSGTVLDRAKALHIKHRVSFWDAMILASCLDAGVEVLYSRRCARIS